MMRWILVMYAAVGAGVAAVGYGDYVGVEMPHYEYEVGKKALASSEKLPPPSPRFSTASAASAAHDEYPDLDYELELSNANDKRIFVKNDLWNKKPKNLHSRSNTDFRSHFLSRKPNLRYKLKNDELREELIWRRTTVGPEQRYIYIDNDIQDVKDDPTDKNDDSIELSPAPAKETMKRNQRESVVKKAPDYYDQREVESRGKSRREPVRHWGHHARRKSRKKTSTQEVAQYDDVKRLQSRSQSISSMVNTTTEENYEPIDQESTNRNQTFSEDHLSDTSTVAIRMRGKLGHAYMTKEPNNSIIRMNMNSRLAWTQLPLKDEIEWLQGATWSEKEQRRALQETTGYPYELLDKAKDIMKQRVRTQAKDLAPLSKTWDVLVCDFIDVALLKDSSISLLDCPILVLVSLSVMAIN